MWPPLDPESLLELSSTSHPGELLAERTYPLSRPKSIAQPYQIFLHVHPLTISSPKERNVAPALPSSNRAQGETGEAVAELRERRGFPWGFLWVFLHHLVPSSPLHVGPELGRQGWRLRGQTSEVSGYFWNFTGERRERERDARRERVHHLNEDGEEAEVSPRRQRGTAVGVGGRGSKSCRFRLDFRKNKISHHLGRLGNGRHGG